MPIDDRPNLHFAAEQFPQLLSAIEAAEKLLKKLRNLHNKGRATHIDVDVARQARDLLLTILDRGAWRQ